jgi:hypothetical protein
MRVKGIEPEALREIAGALGLRLENGRPSGRYYAFTLRVARPLTSDVAQTGDGAWRLDARGRFAPSYRKRGHEDRRWAGGAVCYHGHKAFMDRLFKRAPGAVLVSKLARFNGRESFLAQYEGIAQENVGSLMYPRAFADACRCGEPPPRKAGKRRPGPRKADVLSDRQPADFLPYVMGYMTGLAGHPLDREGDDGPLAPPYYVGHARGRLVHAGKAASPPWIQGGLPALVVAGGAS